MRNQVSPVQQLETFGIVSKHIVLFSLRFSECCFSILVKFLRAWIVDLPPLNILIFWEVFLHFFHQPYCQNFHEDFKHAVFQCDSSVIIQKFWVSFLLLQHLDQEVPQCLWDPSYLDTCIKEAYPLFQQHILCVFEFSQKIPSDSAAFTLLAYVMAITTSCDVISSKAFSTGLGSVGKASSVWV